MDTSKPGINRFYRHTQTSLLFLAILGPVLLFILVLTLSTGLLPVTIFALILIAACLITFITLTIEVKADRIELLFGPGLVRTSFPLRDIRNLEIVRNSFTDGFGMHWTPSSWIFNISGFDAVEIEMKDGNCIRIGTDEPVELVKAIEDALLHLKKRKS